MYGPWECSEDGKITQDGTVRLRLETRGPTGITFEQTLHRTELRAIIAALQFRDWSADCNRGCRSLVITTSSDFIFRVAIDGLQFFEYADWKVHTRTGIRGSSIASDVKDHDLWKLFLAETRVLNVKGVNVSLWLISQEANHDTYQTARRAGLEFEDVEWYQKVLPHGPIRTRKDNIRQKGKSLWINASASWLR